MISPDEYKDKIVDKSPKLYPLIIMRTRTFIGWKGREGRGLITQRYIIRNRRFDNKWYASMLPMLYTRQVAKYENYYRSTHNGRPPMELPYSVEGIYDTEETEAEYNRWSKWVNPGSNWKPGNKIDHVVSGEEILHNELNDANI